MTEANHFYNISPKELADMQAQSNVTLVDVRNQDEVAKGIISGAMHIPLSMLQEKYKALPSNTPIVLYCHSGVRSAHAADFLMSKAYENVYNLTGGILAWGQAGYTLTSPSL